MTIPHRHATGPLTLARAVLVCASLAAGMLVVLGAASRVLAAGIEHPGIGSIANGRGGAFAADPSDGLAFQYNPAGFAGQTGFRATVGGDLSWQGLSFTPTAGSPTISNSAWPFLVPAGAFSYGFGRVGALTGLTLALGATGPSAIGRESYPGDGPQRYSLIHSNYFIGFYSGAIAMAFSRWLSAGVTFQLVKGTAQFSQAVYSGSAQGMDHTQDALAKIDVASPFILTAVFGVTVRPVPRLALGASVRPGFTFLAHGSLTTEIPQAAVDALGLTVNGTNTDFFVRFPDVYRLGGLYTFTSRLLVELDLVAELWSRLKTIEIRPQGITVHSDSFNVTKSLDNIVFQKDFQDAYSVRIGGDYVLLPGRLIVRAGYLHETSAIPMTGVSVDFGNWQRDAVSVGGSVIVWKGLAVDVAYAHHFMATQNVTSTNVVQITTPCVFDDACKAPPALPEGTGTYDGSLDLLSLSLRLTLDDFLRRP